ncbi:hypothetical protein GQ53DRAFT_738155 [Thozetella sp. PMI_491]|nr:hypothetical protein GQ53DRAFT_738155 [Thozetella sp. PMI_491]
MSTKFPCVRVEELVPAALGPNPLYHVGLAIGAIDASRRGTVSTYSGAALAKAFAYTAYRNGVRALRAALAEEDVHQRDDVLVATFLLSLFEVLSEPMGDGWSKHLIHGTCRLVELAGPNLEQPLSFLRRGILAEFRLSEIARAILHGTDTFLAEPVWLEFFRGMGSAKPESWEPQEAMLNLVIMVARFHNRFFNAVEAVPKNERPNLLFLDAFRSKGLELQASIREWYSLASKWQRTANTQSLLWGLGLVYYHALLVHLSDDFVRYFSWSAKPTPSMAEDELREHVDNILSLLIELSSHPYIIGIMLMFPLKLVGSHVTDVETRRKVLGIFDKLYWRGYIASLELKTKMQSSWSNQEEEFEGQLPD